MVDHRSEGAATIVVEALGSDPGLEIIDPIERRRRTLRTPAPVSPTPVAPERFQFPVDTGVAIETDAVSLPTAEQLYVKDAEGQMLAEVEHGTERTFPEATYSLEPTGIIKLHLRVESALAVRPRGHGTEIEFGEETTVLVGSQSSHERPATTVTTTSDPEELLAAISTFGSALKTTSPERAFPTYRGHPPAIDLGAERSIPDGLEPPAETVRVEVPPETEYAYPVAPLAYYLGAPVESGPEPRIVGEGFEHRLDAGESFEVGVERVLKQTFLLDCVARTEGLYRVDLHERRVLEDRLDLDWGALYDAPQHERLDAYLDVPYEVVSDQVPDWKHAAHVDPAIEYAEALPYLVDDLAVVRIAEAETVSAEAVEQGAVQGLMRGGETATRGSAADAGPDAARGAAASDTTFVHPAEQVGSIEEAWVAPGTPLGATKAMTEAYRNRIGRAASTDDIDITVVCNAAAMADERDVVDDVYGSRNDLPFDVTVHRDAATDDLADLLADRRDFLHYIGHIDEDGFRCPDGRLDVAELDEVGVDAFFLNACQSYRQGKELIRGGAIGGIVTLSDVVNHGAVRIGRAVARLLNCGFPLRAALELARDESVIGSLYIVVGDGGLSIVQPESGTPLLYDVDTRGDDFSLSIEMFGPETGIGGLFIPHVGDDVPYYIASGSTEEISLTEDQFLEFIHLEDVPVYLNDSFTWSPELEASDF